jgi:hypothetical protein
MFVRDAPKQPFGYDAELGREEAVEDLTIKGRVERVDATYRDEWTCTDNRENDREGDSSLIGTGVMLRRRRWNWGSIDTVSMDESEGDKSAQRVLRSDWAEQSCWKGTVKDDSRTSGDMDGRDWGRKVAFLRLSKDSDGKEDQ